MWINEQRYSRDQNFTLIDKVTIDDLFKLYRQKCEMKGCSPTYLYDMDSQFNCHIKPFYEDVNLLKVTIEGHKHFIIQMRNKKVGETEKQLSPARINRVRTLMYAMFNTAVKERAFNGLIKENPFTAVAPLKEMNKRIVFWSKEEILTFLKSEKDSYFYPMWILLLNTGLRSGEAVAIHRDQFDTYSHTLTIDRIYCGKTRSIRNETKGSRIRHIALNEAVRKILYAFIKDKEGLIFQNPLGGLLNNDSLSRHVLKRACEKANVRFLGLHAMRHTFASHFMMNGGNLYDLQKILGHSSMKTTERYAHLSLSHMKQVSSVVEYGYFDNVVSVDFRRAN